MAAIYLSIGSNLGDRKRNLKTALEMLSEMVKIEKVSSIFETEPVGFTQQPLFLNTVVGGETPLKAAGLLKFVKDIETLMGRKPSFPNAPRPIDIDILFYGQVVLKSEELTIPHPRLTIRAFVMVPLSEIAPDLVHPGNKRRIGSLIKDLGVISGVHRWGEAEEIWQRS
jgi:2-amino-4-hydroxy-6-hydroxymethyldihydropteridine diphosphokinase